MSKKHGFAWVAVYATGVLVPVAGADQRSAVTSFGLYNDQITCFNCDGTDSDDGSSLNLVVTGLTEATGSVALDVRSFSDLRTDSRWMEVYVGGTRITPSNSSGSPANGQFFRSNGTNQCFCCTPNNNASFTVSDTFFNQRVNNGQIAVQFRIPPTVDVQCMSVGCNNCAGFQYKGQQIATITWTPAVTCSPPCTDTECQFRQCQSGSCVVTGNKSSGTPCGSSSNTDCTNPDTCNGSGSCQSNHASSGASCGDPTDDACTDPDTCNGSGSCLSNHEPNGNDCDDEDPCTGEMETCSGGQCVVGSITDCNENEVDDMCELDVTEFDCNNNWVLDVCEGGPLPPGLFPDMSVPVPSQPGEAPVGSLWRNQLNVIRLAFGCDLPGVPTGGEVAISQMSDGGGGVCAYGTDLSGSFTFSIENTGSGYPRILKIQETGSVLTHRKWYAIRNTGQWTGVADFEAQYVVQVGDANKDLRVLFNDLGVINGSVPCFSDCDERLDIDGDGRILFNDIGIANGSVPSFPVAKPCAN